jgi:excisionase family DNA binding protein
MNMQNDRLLIDARTAARMLGVSPRTLWKLTDIGELPHVRIGRRVLYCPQQLLAWIELRSKRDREMAVWNQELKQRLAERDNNATQATG